MRNIWTIAKREYDHYFISPVAYVVAFAILLVLGIIFALVIYTSAQNVFYGSVPDISPITGSFAFLLVLTTPALTMRLLADENRMGTMELLLTSPLTDMQIILGKFLGALVLYAAMLGVTLLYVAVLFIFGNPEWKPIATAYLGLLLLGGCFISVGMLISSFTRNQIVAGMLTFGVFLLLWIIDWIGSFLGSRGEAIVNYLSITRHFDDFAKGVIDTRHLVYYLSFITFGLFLTAKSVDSERWRG